MRLASTPQSAEEAAAWHAVKWVNQAAGTNQVIKKVAGTVEFSAPLEGTAVGYTSS